MKVISLAMAGAVGLGSIIIATVKWNQQSNLEASKVAVVNYVQQSNLAMDKSKKLLQEQNNELEQLKQENMLLKQNNNNLDNQLKQANTMVGSLNKIIGTLEGDAHFKNMTTAQKKATLNNLLKDWGYGKIAIEIADKVFSWSDGWHFQELYSNQDINNSNEKSTIGSSK